MENTLPIFGVKKKKKKKSETSHSKSLSAAGFYQVASNMWNDQG